MLYLQWLVPLLLGLEFIEDSRVGFLAFVLYVFYFTIYSFSP